MDNNVEEQRITALDCINNTDHFAASVAVIIKHNGMDCLIMGFNWELNCLDNFGGGRQGKENVITTALREFEEESHGAICSESAIRGLIPSSKVMVVKSSCPPPRDKTYYMFLVNLGEQDFETIQDRFRDSIYRHLRAIGDSYGLPQYYDRFQLMEAIHQMNQNIPKKQTDKYMLRVEHTDLALVPLDNLWSAKFTNIDQNTDETRDNSSVNCRRPAKCAVVTEYYGSSISLRPVLTGFVDWVLQQTF